MVCHIRYGTPCPKLKTLLFSAFSRHLKPVHAEQRNIVFSAAFQRQIGEDTAE